ncbi:MAG: 50S ribosomal protein L18 [Microgenomates group bacterium GW2011_GWA1_Microgenomates_45_10]|nr:MAG: 50S ribosomal protein L18 [Microgenomates group bacterium GW2011_GWA2_44_7]KKT78084.1 MAG: 50S ribosomal protein L18 [Microgenomates group bacterium GW2011_GWB1_44_8]KKT87421.1 MAG: 50S ribosomal protein L18 [Microgenomates group bacterium GW2011_GWA1_Microgenomates_45_10]
MLPELNKLTRYQSMKQTKKTEFTENKSVPKQKSERALQKDLVSGQVVTRKGYRLVVARSSKHTLAQVVESETGKVLFTVIDRKSESGTKVEKARSVGLGVAKKAIAKGITKIVFDRNGRQFHGRVAAVAQGAREGGLKL